MAMPENTIRDWLCGPMVAVATPFKEDFSLDLDAYRDNLEFMIKGGVVTGNGSLLVAGAGGEHPALNVEERKELWSVALEVANGRVPVLSSIQHTDYREIIKMAKYASDIGLDGVQLGPTYYYEPSESDALRLFEIVDAESDVMIMLYHTWWEGLTMSVDLVKQIGEIDSVKAVKWSAPDAKLFQDGLKAFAGDLVTIDNSGSHVWSNILGANGFITHLSSFWPDYPDRIWKALQAKDYASVPSILAQFKWGWQEWVGSVVKHTGGEGPFIKAAMEEVGLKAGPPRPPSVRPTKAHMDVLKKLMKDAGVPKVN
ncbi:MAG: dihydrodipicolinate synthase family protein [Dehalococcoidia bacterium]|nr:dihydrodipicolinate synthase family protein [SAR202 cluster bacterium]|tara:strand:+ start:10614 stop:11552 length:939 start_codon:yes stop_codon:yes gene_type:complete